MYNLQINNDHDETIDRQEFHQPFVLTRSSLYAILHDKQTNESSKVGRRTVEAPIFYYYIIIK